MKKSLLVIIYFCTYLFSAKAQTLYGTTFNGGGDRGGTINKFVPASANLTVAKSFESVEATPYYTNFIQAGDGKLYGMTYGGGSNFDGAIFSFDPSSSTYKKLKDFDYDDGAYPYGSLIQASDHKLYGMTTYGGSAGYGVIFSFDPVSSTYKKLKEFDNTNGSYPSGSLIQGTDGKLYGLTYGGGSSGAGVIFSFDPVSSTFINLKNLDYFNDGSPVGDLMQASDGKLYGMTVNGGTNYLGVIFSLNPSSLTYQKLLDFENTIGGNPYGNLIQATNGKLYGMTSSEGANYAGVIFSFDPSTSVYAKLKDFDGITGGNPYGNLIQAKNGKLYGTTKLGGTNQAGVIFSVDPSSTAYTKLMDFDNTSGGNPYGSLLQASNGNLFGMTFSGGIANNGVIFSFDISASKYTKFKDFGTNKIGRNLSAGLLQASDAKLYGTATGGGSSGNGLIFSYDPSSSVYKKLKDFDYTSGSYPSGSLIQATDGKLYGMTAAGGGTDGVIFSYNFSSDTYTKIMDFDGANGSSPYGHLMQASNKKLYGMTLQGGDNNVGVIFSFDPSSLAYTKLKDFNETDGKSPYGSLMQASDGKLYGMTSLGGSTDEYGVLFSFDPSSSIYTKIWNFDISNGANPYGSLIQASNGKLYGMASKGGSSGNGVIFSFDPSASTYKKLKDLDSANGANPLGSLMQASDGKLYGLTNRGGSSDYGVIFSLDPSTSAYVKLKSFDNINGANPDIGAAFIEVAPGINKAPTVSITNPLNNASYAAPANIIINAAASDSDGTISYVEFYNDTVLMKRDSTSPYTDTVKKLAAGSYLITAKATDNFSKTTTSAAVHITAQPSSTMEAEDAVLKGSIIASNQAGFTGSGFADYTNASGDYIEWTVNEATAGNFSLNFRYANGATVNRPLKLEVNGTIVATSLNFLPTGGWAKWSISSVAANLLSGSNKVRLTTIGSNGPNLDNLGVSVITLEAEGAVLNGPVVASNQPGFKGAGFADYVNASGDYIEWTVNEAAAGDFFLHFRYANGAAVNRPLKLEVNGKVIAASLSFLPTGGWAKWLISSATANLLSGPNKIRLTTIGSNGPNVDNVSVSAVTLEAEDAVLKGSLIASNQPGFTGAGFADYVNASGDFIEWTVNGAAAGKYSLNFRYANGAAVNRPLKLEVNGTVIAAGLNFPPTGGWAKWLTSSVTANLISGSNTIRLTTTGSNGPNMDHLTLNSITTLEAEDAVLSGPLIASNQPGFTGSGFADYVNASGDFIEWTVNAAASNNFTLNFRYANGGGTDRPLKLQVNGTVIVAKLSFSPTGGWAKWSTSSAIANLIAGSNKIRLTTTGSKGPNVDQLALNVSSSFQAAIEGIGLTKDPIGAPGFLKAYVAPNPVNSNAKLNILTSSTLPVYFELIDILGRSYKSPKFVSAGHNIYNFSIGDLSAGSYIIILKQGKLSTSAKFIVEGN